MPNSKVFEYAGECAKQSFNVEFLISASLLSGIYSPIVGLTGSAGHFTSCMTTKISHDLIDSSDSIREEFKPTAKFLTQSASGTLKYSIKYGFMLSGYNFVAKVTEGFLNGAAYNLLNSNKYDPVAAEFSSGILGDYIKEALNNKDGSISLVKVATSDSAVLNALVGVLVVGGIELHKKVSPLEDYAFMNAINNTLGYDSYSEFWHILETTRMGDLFPAELKTCEAKAAGDCPHHVAD